MEFTEAESNMNDLVSEYQQYQVALNYWQDAFSVNLCSLSYRLVCLNT